MAEGKAIPYGTYEIGEDRAVVNVGVTHDTAEFAVESIRRWGKLAGRHRKQGAQRILICADAGGSNSSRSRTWKLHLQELADELGMAITVCHHGLPLPAGNEQVEQDRTPAVFVHQSDLEREAADQASGTRSNTGCFRSSV